MTTATKAPRVEVSGAGYGSVSVTDTAKLVRYWLAREFPGVKFSVRSSRYAGGAALHVEWTDGPLVQQVDTVIRPFTGEGFDGMTDSTTRNEAWFYPATGKAFRFASGIGHSAGTVVRNAAGTKLPPEQHHDYMAGVMTVIQGTTTRRGYDPDSDAFRMGQADARSLTADGARLVSFRADHIQTRRDFSGAYRAELERAVMFLAGEDGEFDGNRRYDVRVQLPGGPEEYGHTLVYRLSRLDPGQLDAWIAEEAERRAIVAARLFSAQARGSQEARGETGPGVTGYYVTVKDGPRWAALLGPYDTRPGAEAAVPEGRKLAETADDRATWYAYGVTKVRAKPGRELSPGNLEKLPARQLALAFGTETAT
jgi:hypothetical protein